MPRQSDVLWTEYDSVHGAGLVELYEKGEADFILSAKYSVGSFYTFVKNWYIRHDKELQKLDGLEPKVRKGIKMKTIYKGDKHIRVRITVIDAGKDPEGWEVCY